MGLGIKIIYGIIFPLMFCFIGGGLFARKGYVHLRTQRDKKIRCLSETTGKIVKIASMRMKKRLTYFPTYAYKVGNQVYSVEIEFGTTNCQYKKGEEVKVWYDSNLPDYSYIADYKEENFAAIVSLILGSIAALGGLFVGSVVWFG